MNLKKKHTSCCCILSLRVFSLRVVAVVENECLYEGLIEEKRKHTVDSDHMTYTLQLEV